MHCPLCGSVMRLVEKKPSDDLKRDEYVCTKSTGGCFREDYPLYFHHPFRGIDSVPGDSWSLSWVQ